MNENLEEDLKHDDESSDEEDFELRSLLQKLEREKQRDKKRPEISALEDAIKTIQGVPFLKLNVGEMILIERYTEYYKTTRWFDTRTYEIKSINPDTGAIRLYDQENKQYALTNFITGHSNPRYKFKIPSKTKNKKLKLDQKTGTTVSSSKSKSSDGLRTVYSSKNVIHTRINNVPYGPKGETKSKPGLKFKMKLNSDSTITVECLENKWSETWCQITL